VNFLSCVSSFFSFFGLASLLPFLAPFCTSHFL
jgi:hypothetical protein